MAGWQDAALSRLCRAGAKKALPALLAPLTILLATLTGIPSAEASTDLRDEIECLALNIYHEARGEPDEGKVAVGHVVLNRVADERFPDGVCDVIRQGGERKRLRCQFTWWCDGRSDEPEDLEAWDQSKRLALSVFWGFADDPTEGALWYHASYVKPVWRKKLVEAAKIGSHHFYVGEQDLQRQASDR